MIDNSSSTGRGLSYRFILPRRETSASRETDLVNGLNPGVSVVRIV